MTQEIITLCSQMVLDEANNFFGMMECKFSNDIKPGKMDFTF